MCKPLASVLQCTAHLHKAKVRLPLQRPHALQTLVLLAVAVQPPGWGGGGKRAEGSRKTEDEGEKKREEEEQGGEGEGKREDMGEKRREGEEQGREGRGKGRGRREERQKQQKRNRTMDLGWIAGFLYRTLNCWELITTNKHALHTFDCQWEVCLRSTKKKWRGLSHHYVFLKGRKYVCSIAYLWKGSGSLSFSSRNVGQNTWERMNALSSISSCRMFHGEEVCVCVSVCIDVCMGGG